MVRALIRISRFQTDLRTDDTKLVRIARKLSEVEPQVQKRNFPSVEQIQDSPAIDTIKRLLTESFLIQVDCIGGRRTPKQSLLRVQRERAEAGVLLFEVMKSQKQNTELPLNASDQDKSPYRQLKKR